MIYENHRLFTFIHNFEYIIDENFLITRKKYEWKMTSNSYFVNFDAFIVTLVIESPYLESFIKIYEFVFVYFPR